MIFSAKKNRAPFLSAESWAQAALATYMQQTFKLSSPPKPASVDITFDNDNSADIEVNDIGTMPDWFAPPVIANAVTKESGQPAEPNPPVPTDDPNLGTLDPSPPPPAVPSGGSTT